MASDSAVRAGTSANVRQRFCIGAPPTKLQRYASKVPKSFRTSRNLFAFSIAAAIENAKRFLEVRKDFGTFDAYLWSFVGGAPIQNRWRTLADVPARTAESDAMNRDLLRRGFKFAGSTICYAFMQATGMVNDHLVSCPRHAELGGAPRK